MLTHRTTTIIGDIPPDWQPKPLRTLLEKQSSGDWDADEGDQAVTVLPQPYGATGKEGEEDRVWSGGEGMIAEARELKLQDRITFFFSADL